MCVTIAKAVKSDLAKASFNSNDEKSVWEPCQKLDWLGITWDSTQGIIQAVDRRIAKISRTIENVINSNFVISARKLASFMGQAIYTAPVIRNISRIMTSHCVMSTLCVQHWDAEVELDQYCIEEIHFWRNNL